MTRYISIWCLALLLTGCGTLDRIGDSGAQANDKALATSLFTLCRGASVGSVQRTFGASEARAAAWRTLCLNDGEFAVPFGS